MARLRRAIGAVCLSALAILSAAAVAADLPLEIRRGLLKQDYAGAVAGLRALSEQGDAQALYELGRLYGQGLGVPRDDAGALEFLRRAADLGHTEAAYLAGTFLEDGRGRGADRHAATEYYRQAIAQGHRLAQHRLSALISNAPGQPADSGRPDGRTPGRPELTARQRDADEPPSLGVAVQRGDLAEVEALLAAGAGIDQLDDLGNAALHYAVQAGSREMVQVLLNAGADASRQDRSGNTALHLAVAAGLPEIARMLLGVGASRTTTNGAGWTPEMLAQRSSEPRIQSLLLDSTVTAGDAASLVQLRALRENAAMQGWTELGIAAWQGELDLVEALVRGGASLDQRDAEGISPLGRSVMGQRIDVARHLIEIGADTGIGIGGGSVLHEAIRQRDPDMVQTLAEQEHLLKRRDAAGRSPLLLAVELGEWSLADALIRAGAVVAMADADGNSPLHLLARANRLALATAVLRAGANVDAADGAGRTSLWWAARLGEVDMAKLLLRAGATGAPANDGSTPVHQAAQLQRADLIALLSGAGHPLGVRTLAGSTPLLIAAEKGGAETVEFLVARGVSVNATNRSGDSPLICAARNDRKPVARLLMQSGANPHLRNAQFVSARDLVAGLDDPEWRDILDSGPGLLGLLGIGEKQ